MQNNINIIKQLREHWSLFNYYYNWKPWTKTE